MKNVFFLLLLIGSCKSIYAQNNPLSGDDLLKAAGIPKVWTSLGYYDKTNEVFIMDTCVKADKQFVKVWTKIMSVEDKILGKTYHNVTTKILYTFDCVNRKAKQSYTAVYDVNGNLIRTWTSVNTWIKIVPDSPGETLLDKASELYLIK